MCLFSLLALSRQCRRSLCQTDQSLTKERRTAQPIRRLRGIYFEWVLSFHRQFSHESKSVQFELSFEWRYFGPCVRKFTSRCVTWIAHFEWSFEWRYFGPCVRKFTSRCVTWIAHFEWSFEWQYFGPCVHKITSRCLIWIAQFKWRSGPLFELRINQNAQYKLRIAMWFGVHTVQNTVIRMIIQIAHFCSHVKIFNLFNSMQLNFYMKYILNYL